MAKEIGDRYGRDATGESARFGLVVAASVVALCAIVAYRDTLELWFTGIDALPLVLSNRLDSLLAAPKLLVREYLEAYSDGRIAGSTGIRPVGSASLALDYALWGLNPRGYHLTSMVIHALNSVLVLFFVRELRPRRWLAVGVVAALAFALHPVGAATVPLMGTRYDLLLCTFTLLTLIGILRYLAAPTGRRLTTVLAGGGLALLSKETAVLLFLIVVMTAGWAWIRGTLAMKPMLRMIAGFAALLVVYVAYRTLVLHGLGGYAIRARSPIDGALIMSRWFFVSLLRPYPFARATTEWHVAASVIAATFGALVLAFGIAATWASLTRSLAVLRISGRRQAVNDLDRAALLALWLLSAFCFYTLAYVVTGVFKDLYLYSTLGVWCTLFGIGVVAVYERVTSRDPATRTTALSRATWAIAAGGLILTGVSWVRHSALVDSLRMWRRASSVALSYIGGVEEAVSRLPAGATLFLVNLPQEIDCGSSVCAGNGYIFEDYSIDSWFALARPTTRVRFVAVTSMAIGLDSLEPRSRWLAGASPDTILGELSGAFVRHPFFSRASDYFDVALSNDDAPRTRITVTDPNVFEGTHFVYDYFSPNPLMSLTAAGLRPVAGALP